MVNGGAAWNSSLHQGYTFYDTTLQDGDLNDFEIVCIDQVFGYHHGSVGKLLGFWTADPDWGFCSYLLN